MSAFTQPLAQVREDTALLTAWAVDAVGMTTGDADVVVGRIIAALDRVERLAASYEKQLEDFATHGTRFDCNPTRIIPTDPVSIERDGWWQNRAQSMDKAVRDRARAVLSAREEGATGPIGGDATRSEYRVGEEGTQA